MQSKFFSKSFTQQESIPEAAIERAVQIMKTGRLHRYNVQGDEASETALLEIDFAAYLGMSYCLACASCGMAMFLALKSIGVERGDKVLCNSFTLAPVPGSIHHVGAEPVLVEITDNYTIDTADLAKKAASTGAKWLLLSHMRGHLADMEQVLEICAEHHVTVIEDCAHTMGATWAGKKSGTFGVVSCFSTQTYKHMNSGEGGLLVTDDPEVIAKAILFSGSYMLYEMHRSRPEIEFFQAFKLKTPNYSCRMDNLRAALLRAQLQDLDDRCRRWNERYRLLEQLFNEIDYLCCPSRPTAEGYVGSSIQFRIDGQGPEAIQEFVNEAKRRGIVLAWFGATEPIGFTSAYDSWRYLDHIPVLPRTKEVLATTCDMRVPLTFSLEDCAEIAGIIKDISNVVFR